MPGGLTGASVSGVLDLAAENGPAARLRRGLASSRRRVRLAALGRDAGPRPPARAVDHDADDARVRAWRSCWAAGRGRARRPRARPRCDADSATRARRLVRAGRRRATTSAPTSTSSSCSRVARAGRRRAAAARRWRCSTRASGTSTRRAGRRWNRDWRARGLPRREREHARRRGDARHRGPAVARAGGRITQRLVVDNHPRLNEHFDAEWRPLPDYNRDRAGGPVPALRRDDRALVRVGAAVPTRSTRPPLRGRRARGCSPRAYDGWDGQRLRLHGRLGRRGRSSPTAALGAVRGDRRRRGAGRGRAAGRVVGARRADLHRPRGRLVAGTSSTRPTARRPPSGTASRTSTTRCRRR